MSTTIRSLLTNFGADPSGFSKGAGEVKRRLTELNSEYYKNSAQLKNLNSEYTKTEKELKNLRQAMSESSGGTSEQKERLAQLSTLLDTTTVKIGSLKTAQISLREQVKQATNELREQTVGMSESVDTAQRTSNGILQFGTAVKALIFGYTGKKLSDVFIGSNAEMEQYIVGFETMLGDAQKAQKLVENLTTFAANTPLGVEQSIVAAEMLMNYGVAADDVVGKLTQLGDLAKGNAEKLDRVSLAYGQMLAKGKVTGEELRQMTEAGVPLLQALADTLNVSTAELGKMIETGKVGIPDLDAAIAGLTTGSGKFAGMMEAQSKTLTGMLSTLGDDLAQIGRDAGEKGFVKVKETVADLLDTLKQAKEDGTIDQITRDVGDGISVVASALGTSVKLVWEYREAIVATTTAVVAYKTTMIITEGIEKFKKATDAATVSQGLFNAALMANPYALVAAALAGLTITAIAFGGEADELTRKIETNNEATVKLRDSISKLQSDSSGALADYDRIAEMLVPKIGELGEKTNISAEEQALLEKYIAEVNAALGYQAYSIDTVSGALSGNTTEIYKNIEALKQRAKAEAAYELMGEAQKQLLLSQQAEAEAAAGMQNTPYDNSKFWGVFANRAAILAEQKWRQASENRHEAEKNVKDLEDLYAKALESQTEYINKSNNADAETAKKNQKAYEELKFLRDADLMSESDYISELTRLRDEAQGVDEAAYRKYYLEIYKIQQASQKERLASQKSYKKDAQQELNKFVSENKKQYDKYYSAQKDRIKEDYDERIKAVEKWAKSEEKRINDTVAAIDKEIQARQRLKAETDYDKQISAVQAQLQYAQLDEFTRRDLQRQLATLQAEKEEQQWQWQQEDTKTKLKDELQAIRDSAAAQKEALKEEQEAALKALDRQKEKMQEVFEYISDNFTSLSQLQQSGIQGIQDLFLLATANSDVAIQNTFALLYDGTQLIGDHYAQTVNSSVTSTFDHAVTLAKQALNDLRVAIGLANEAAADLRSASASRNSSVSYNNNSKNNVTFNSGMTESQTKRIINDIFGSKYGG